MTDQRQFSHQETRVCKQLRALLARAERLRKEERATTRALYDDVTQALAAIRMDMTLLKGELPIDTRGSCARIVQSIDVAIERFQRISLDSCHPVCDMLRLVAAIEWAAYDFGVRTGIRSGIAARDSDISDFSEKSE
jgi:signal transduction histidine kinase